jgi:gamma-glutamyltranspeptidase/glutathione hydrolase
MALLLSVHSGCAHVDLSPTQWGEGELEKYVRTERIAEPVSRSSTVMVTGTSSSIAIRSGVEALKQGGNALDAALTTALTHVTLAGGCTVSFAGVMTLAYYDASSGEVFALDGGYNTVRNETDPLTIPRSSRSDPTQGTGAIPKGRTVLVPGFMAGLEAAHARFGRLPFSEIFQPAIYFAREGFPISPRLSELVEANRHVLSRLPETWAVFTREDGSLYAPGERFRQPALATTLETVAREGAGYLYRGAWAKKLVDAVRRDGGKMTLEDLDRYRPTWHEPIQVTYRGRDVYLPSGGSNLAGMLHLLELSNLADRGDYAVSAESFYWFCRIVRAVNFGTGLEEIEYRQEDWTDAGFARRAWDHLQNGQARGSAADPTDGSLPGHSDAVVVVDGDGNVAALLHSSNAIGFGESGIYIDGVSIPDSATFQQVALSYTEPGDRLANPTTPLIVLENGRPVLGLSAIGSGMYEETIKCLFNMLGFDKPVQDAIDAPTIVPTFGQAVDSPSVAIAVPEGTYPPALIDEARRMGLDIEVLPERDARRTKGAVAAITVDPVTRTREGGSVRRFSLGY